MVSCTGITPLKTSSLTGSLTTAIKASGGHKTARPGPLLGLCAIKGVNAQEETYPSCQQNYSLAVHAKLYRNEHKL